jgi:hypothetical protein
MTFGVLKKNILRQCITPQSIIMPTKRKGASKHRQSRRSRRHSRRSVRGAGKFPKFKESIKSFKSRLSMFKKKPTMTLKPSHSGTYVVNRPFQLIGKNADSERHTNLLKYTGMIDGMGKYMPGGFVYWRGDDEARKPHAWYEVKEFDDNMPVGEAYRVSSPDNPVRIKDTRGDDEYEVFHFVAKSGPALDWHDH